MTPERLHLQIKGHGYQTKEEVSIAVVEHAQMNMARESEPIPNTLSGFQGHALYCLEDQLHKYEVRHLPIYFATARYPSWSKFNIHFAQSILERSRVRNGILQRLSV